MDRSQTLTDLYMDGWEEDKELPVVVVRLRRSVDGEAEPERVLVYPNGAVLYNNTPLNGAKRTLAELSVFWHLSRRAMRRSLRRLLRRSGEDRGISHRWVDVFVEQFKIAPELIGRVVGVVTGLLVVAGVIWALWRVIQWIMLLL